MSGHQFTFPPPPLAPLSQSYPGISEPVVGSNGYKLRDNSRNHGNRAIRHGPIRGGRRVGHFGSSQSNSSYGSPSLNIDQRQSSAPDTSFHVPKNDYRRSEYPLPSYPPVQLPQFPVSVRQSYGPQNPVIPADTQPSQAAYSANGNGSHQNYNIHHQYSSHGYGPSFPIMRASGRAAQNNSSFQINAHAGQPVLMGPPIRMGFDAQRNSSQTQQHGQPTANMANAHRHGFLDGNESQYRNSSPTTLHPGHQGSPNAFAGKRGRGAKRGYGVTYSRPRNQNQRTQVAPAVPRFGSSLPLPVKPPALHGDTRKPRKKKRKHNQLGLTPKAEEHESSEEEEDTDEEATLAARAANASQGHQL